jgi:N-methylhydantoinase A/oxoprolinase/acetone carboxylase beta subunit
MVAFGGAAGLHGVAGADELGLARVVFPESASTLSAYGILHSNLAHDLVRSKVLPAGRESLATLAAMTEGLLADAQARLDADAVSPADRQIDLAADMRYKGQAFELTVPSAATRLDETTLDGLIAGFHDIHRQRFSYANPGSPVEIVSLRVAAVGRLPRPQGKPPAHAAGEREAPRHRRVWMSGAWQETPVWSRGRIGAGTTLTGPAVIEEAYTTVLLAQGWTCRREASGHLIAERAQP